MPTTLIGGYVSAATSTANTVLLGGRLAGAPPFVILAFLPGLGLSAGQPAG